MTNIMKAALFLCLLLTILGGFDIASSAIGAPDPSAVLKQASETGLTPEEIETYAAREVQNPMLAQFEGGHIIVFSLGAVVIVALLLILIVVAAD